MKGTSMNNVVTAIIDYENDELDADGIIELFQHLVDTGEVWGLQGHYGRMARALIDAGQVTLKEDTNER